MEIKFTPNRPRQRHIKVAIKYGKSASIRPKSEGVQNFVTKIKGLNLHLKQLDRFTIKYYSKNKNIEIDCNGVMTTKCIYIRNVKVTMVRRAKSAIKSKLFVGFE